MDKKEQKQGEKSVKLSEPPSREFKARSSSREPARFPQEGELVMGTVTKVFPYGAFIRLEEYPGKEGMIHISEISSKWIKNIREYIKEGEKVVVKVLKIDRDKGHIDLSLKSVKAVQKKQKTEETKREKRGIKLLELCAGKLKDEEHIGEIASKLEDKFGAVLTAFESASNEGEQALSSANIPEKWAKEIARVAKEHVEIPKVKVKAVLELHSSASNGAEIIRDSLVKAQEKYSTKDIEISIKYLGAPQYKVEVKGQNYKVVESCMDKLSKEVIDTVNSNQGIGKLIR